MTLTPAEISALIELDQKRTPGDWLLNVTKVEEVVVRWHIAGKLYGSVYPVCEHVFEYEPSATEQLANGQFIASAPRLAQALRQVLAEMDEAVRLLNMAKQQIAKWQHAYGEHQPEWLPPAGDVQLAEDIHELLGRKGDGTL